MKKKAIFNWSGGKDSAHALWRVLQGDEYEVVALLTTINRETSLSTMHNIPMELLQAQSESIGIPLEVVELKSGGSMTDYGEAMERMMERWKAKGVESSIFGDIYLHDVRSYREAQLKPMGIEVVEPLWGKPSRVVMEEYLETGLQTVVVTTMADGLGMEAIGRVIDAEFVRSMPEEMDVNGENGEYHTFCYDGPLFRHAVGYRLGKAYTKSYEIGMEDGSEQTFSYCFGDLESIENKII